MGMSGIRDLTKSGKKWYCDINYQIEQEVAS